MSRPFPKPPDMMPSRPIKHRSPPDWAGAISLACLVLALGPLAFLLPHSPLRPAAAFAQAVGAEPPVQVPGFWDPRRRPERPDLNRVVVIRFLTEIDYPPFNFAGPDGNPQGFN